MARSTNKKRPPQLAASFIYKPLPDPTEALTMALTMALDDRLNDSWPPWLAAASSGPSGSHTTHPGVLDRTRVLDRICRCRRSVPVRQHLLRRNTGPKMIAFSI